MQYRKLGSSDLQLSEIGLGSWLTYGETVETERAQQCVDAAFEAGINFIDTANIYGRGTAETFLGNALKSRPRESYVLATKLFFPMDANNKGLSAKQIEKQSEDSLRRLQTDYVDLYQCHRYDPETPLEETMTALTRLVESGKVRYIGFSEWTPEQIRAAAEIPNVTRFVSSQPQYSMLHRNIEHGVIETCEELNIGQVVWSPLAQGVLTGKYKPGQALPDDSRASSRQLGHWIADRVSNDALLTAVQELASIADELNISMPQLALAWVLRQKNVTSAIIGASRPSQVADNAAASGITLDEKTLLRIDDVIGHFAL